MVLHPAPRLLESRADCRREEHVEVILRHSGHLAYFLHGEKPLPLLSAELHSHGHGGLKPQSAHCARNLDVPHFHCGQKFLGQHLASRNLCLEYFGNRY